MAYDINLYREKHIDGKWVSADVWEPWRYDPEVKLVPHEKRFTDRNYDLFSILAGVRTRNEPPYKFAPRGIPVSMSPEVRDCYDGGGYGNHAPSYLYLHELREVRAIMPAEHIACDALDRIIASLSDIGGDNQRIVFWFD